MYIGYKILFESLEFFSMCFFRLRLEYSYLFVIHVLLQLGSHEAVIVYIFEIIIIVRTLGTRDEGESDRAAERINLANERGRQGEREKTLYLHASLIYAHRPATSDKSLTPRHYLFVCVYAFAHFFQTSRENDTLAMNIKRTPTPGRHWYHRTS